MKRYICGLWIWVKSQESRVGSAIWPVRCAAVGCQCGVSVRYLCRIIANPVRTSRVFMESVRYCVAEEILFAWGHSTYPPQPWSKYSVSYTSIHVYINSIVTNLQLFPPSLQYYICIQHSVPRRQEKRATTASGQLSLLRVHCLSFSYLRFNYYPTLRAGKGKHQCQCTVDIIFPHAFTWTNNVGH